jgi:hypothetical protein
MCLQRQYCCIARYDALYAVTGRRCFQLPRAATAVFWICCCSGLSLAVASSIAALGSVLQIRAQLPQCYVVVRLAMCSATATVLLMLLQLCVYGADLHDRDVCAGGCCSYEDDWLVDCALIVQHWVLFDGTTAFDQDLTTPGLQQH